ncbi:MAG: hypothetical protein DRI57_02530 [Deltaproteobacteria bacterium]|nr:MAG: hypothetical protein DRI57_02530 [Deltaproteobacteria bacterium]
MLSKYSTKLKLFSQYVIPRHSLRLYQIQEFWSLKSGISELKIRDILITFLFNLLYFIIKAYFFDSEKSKTTPQRAEIIQWESVIWKIQVSVISEDYENLGNCKK